jgi:hypothetical protein
MKNTKSYALFFSLIFTSFFAQGQFEANKQIFRSPNLDKVKSDIKSVAILPFDIAFSYKKLPKGMTVDLINEEEEKARTEFQQGLYTYLLRIQNEIPATVQNPDRTNALLKRAGIKTKEDLESMLMDSLAGILGVDALIKSKWNYAKTGSEGGAIVKAALFGFGGATGSGALILQVYNGKDGELLWRFFKEMNEGLGSDATDTMERMMRKVGRNFPLQTEVKK